MENSETPSFFAPFDLCKWLKQNCQKKTFIFNCSEHTLGTLNHGLGPLFCCFITLFGAGGSLDPPAAPWRPPGPPGAPLAPGMSS